MIRYFVTSIQDGRCVTIGNSSGYESRTIPFMLATELSIDHQYDSNQVVIEHRDEDTNEVVYAELFENGKSRM